MQISLTEHESGRKPINWRRLAPGLVLVGVALIVIGVAVTLAVMTLSDDGSHSIEPIRLPPSPHVPTDPAKITAADPDQLKPVSPEDAEVQNAAIPISTQPNPAAVPLAASTRDMTSLARSVDCLTSAVYYEAATEPLDGQRAVAQVVLNRVRHPSFPHTVCGVVYQGSGRSTGCQFTFTCDGSLARKPIPALWTKARSVAVAALAGSVYAPVGWSTYYHADYVIPYWAPTLTKLMIVGRHIFYRLPGTGGAPKAFSVRYAGNEPDISAISAAAAALPSALPASAVATPAITTPSSARPILSGSTGLTGGDGRAVAAPSGPPAPLSSRWIMSSDGHPIDGPVGAAGKVAPLSVTPTAMSNQKPRPSGESLRSTEPSRPTP